MTVKLADVQQRSEAASSGKKIDSITNENAKRTFLELSKTYEDYVSQTLKIQGMLKLLVGNQEDPGTLWSFVEYYGTPLNKDDDPQEHVLRHGGKVWGIRRVNPKYSWDKDNTIKIFQLAYKVSIIPEEDVPALESGFSEFKTFLEKTLDRPLDLDPDAWWQLIDDGADLYRTTVTRTLNVEALNSIRKEIPKVFVEALCSHLDPEYSLQVTKDASKNLTVGDIGKTDTCKNCTSSVDADDFYCRNCGSALGSE